MQPGESDFERVRLMGPSDAAELEALIARFEDAWKLGKRPSVAEYLPVDEDFRAAALVELVHTDLEYRLKSGEDVKVDDYLERFPELRAGGSAAEELISAERDLRGRCVGSASPPTVAAHGETPDPPAGFGKFTALELLGQGSCGRVYRARDTDLDRDVTIKIPHAGPLGTGDGLERFLREARSAAQLEHPGIVSVRESGRVNGVPYLAAEFVDGINLAEKLKEGKTPPRDAAELVARVADALSHAHERGVIHRDLKPSNILIDRDGRPRVTDFGLARREAADATLTADGQLLGTPAYMSPEQARGDARNVDERSDVYSLGVILYELLTGERPFRGNDRMVLNQVLEDEPRAPRRLDDGIPRDLETVALRAMAKEPSARYATASEVAADLRRFLRREPVHARPVSGLTRAWCWCRRRPALAGLAAALVVVLCLGFAGVTWQWRRAELHLDGTKRQRFLAENRIEETFEAMAEWSRSMQEKMPGLERFRRDVAQELLGEYLSGLEDGAGDDPLASTTPGPPFAIVEAATLWMEPEEALPVWEKALECWGRELRESRRLDRMNCGLALTCYRVGLFQNELGRAEEALANLEKARTTLAACAEEIPDDPRFRLCLRNAEFLVGEQLWALDRTEEALRVFEKLSRENPDDPEFRDRAVECYLKIADTGEESRADRAMRAFETLAGSDQYAGDRARRHRAVQYYVHLADRVRESGLKEETLSVIAKAATFCERCLEADPEDPDTLYWLGALLARRTNVENELGLDGAAFATYAKVRSVAERGLSRRPRDFRFLQLMANACYSLGYRHFDAGRPDEAVRHYRTAMEHYERALREVPEHQYSRMARARCLVGIGEVELDRGRLEEALRAREEIVGIAEELLRSDPTSTRLRGFLAMGHHGLGNMLRDVGRYGEAVTSFEKALEISEALCREASGTSQHCDEVESTRRRLQEAREAAAESPAP